MKYIMLVGDGMADRPVEELDGKTPLEIAKTPNMDSIVKEGQLGMVRTIPAGFTPASDVANLAIMGYDPAQCYTGRGPLEAANMGITLAMDEVAFRCNTITIADSKIVDYSAGHISSEEAKLIIKTIDQMLGSASIKFYPGISYRHLMILKTPNPDYYKDLICKPPHDIMGKAISKNLPKGEKSAQERIIKLIKDSWDILAKHEINQVRIDLKENPANSIWLWGQGTKPNMPNFKEFFGISGAVISAVDLVKGIARLVGLDPIEVEGATGYYDTNYLGKGQAAIEALKTGDFVFVHVEAPDEAGHNGDVRAKITAIENFDRDVVGTVLNYARSLDSYRLMVLPDHATPLSVRTHTNEPVLFGISGSGIEPDANTQFNEPAALESKLKVDKGHELMKMLLK